MSSSTAAAAGAASGADERLVKAREAHAIALLNSKATGSRLQAAEADLQRAELDKEGQRLRDAGDDFEAASKDAGLNNIRFEELAHECNMSLESFLRLPPKTLVEKVANAVARNKAAAPTTPPGGSSEGVEAATLAHPTGRFSVPETPVMIASRTGGLPDSHDGTPSTAPLSSVPETPVGIASRTGSLPDSHDGTPSTAPLSSETGSPDPVNMPGSPISPGSSGAAALAQSELQPVAVPRRRKRKVK
jgi:hypothetical protein